MCDNITYNAAPPKKPEETLADEIRKELNVRVDPQALRMFVRSRWETIKRCAHRIHEA